MLIMIAGTACNTVDDSRLFLYSGFCLSAGGTWRFSQTASTPGDPLYGEDRLLLFNGATRGDSANGIEMFIDNGGKMYHLNSHGDFYEYQAGTNTFTFYFATPTADDSIIFP